jgi:hypothetical protein
MTTYLLLFGSYCPRSCWTGLGSEFFICSLTTASVSWLCNVDNMANNVCGAVDGTRTGREIRIIRRKSYPTPICLHKSQITNHKWADLVSIPGRRGRKSSTWLPSYRMPQDYMTVGNVYFAAIGNIRVIVTLQLAAYRQSVHLEDKHLETLHLLSYFLCNVLSWREDLSPIYNCCWYSPTESFSGSIPAGVLTTFYCLRFRCLYLLLAWWSTVSLCVEVCRWLGMASKDLCAVCQKPFYGEQNLIWCGEHDARFYISD